MKKLKRIVSLLMAVAVCTLLPGWSTLTASANTPVTYYLNYVAANNEWRFQTGSVWDDSAAHRELYYMHQDIKDGDIIVIGNNQAGLNLSVPVRLSNLTIVQGATSIVVAAGSIDECYVLGDTVAAISGDVKNAYVYDNACCTFNNNVNKLSVMNDPAHKETLLQGTVTVAGTVNQLVGIDGTSKVHYELYSFQAGKLNVTKGEVKTDAAFFSKTAATSGNTSSADEYDEVPKTGDSHIALWLLAASALCFLGRYGLKKTQS